MKTNSICAILLFITILSFTGCTTVVKTDYSNKNLQNATLYYYLPQSKINIEIITVYDCIVNKEVVKVTSIVRQEYKITEEQIADTDKMFTLTYNPNILMQDELKYTINDKGLLDTISIETEDRTANAIEKLAQAVSPSKTMELVLKDDLPQKKIIEVKQNLSFLVKDLQKIGKIEKYFNDIVQNSTSTGYEICNYKISVNSDKADFGSVKDPLSEVQDIENFDKGIFTRPKKNLKLNISVVFKNEKLPVISDYQYISIVDASRLVALPVKRTMFAKQENSMKFKDGILQSNYIKKPSSVEGFANIPINLAKSIFGIPAEIIRIRYDNMGKKMNYEGNFLKIKKSLDSLKKIQEDNQKIITAIAESQNNYSTFTAEKKIDYQDETQQLEYYMQDREGKNAYKDNLDALNKKN